MSYDLQHREILPACNGEQSKHGGDSIPSPQMPVIYLPDL